jgi:hypothetical protein
VWAAGIRGGKNRSTPRAKKLHGRAFASFRLKMGEKWPIRSMFAEG